MHKALITLLLIITPAIAATAQQDSTLIPDRNFEQLLVDRGIDTSGVDGMVITADIEGITVLNIAGAGIANLAGIEDFSALEELNCSSNLLDTLDLMANSSLRVIDCSNNNLESLTISTSAVLERLNCSSNRLDTLDTAVYDSLTYLDCSGNWLKDIDVSSNKLLTTLACGNNQLSTLDVSQNSQLFYLFCSDNMLASLDISNNLYLRNLTCSFNQLPGVVLAAADYDSLEVLSCSYNQVNILDVSSMPALTNLDCASNQVEILDLSNNMLLESLDCSRNLLTTLDLSSNTLLSTVNISSNLVAWLDLRSDTSLTTLDCSDNLLEGVDIANGENDSIDIFNAMYNPSLRCIVVDDPVAAESRTKWMKDDIADYQTVCIATTAIPDAVFEQFLVDAGYDITDPGNIPDGYVHTGSIDTITRLDLSSLLISDLKGIEDFHALEELTCTGTLISYLDVSRNTNLVKLICSDNLNLTWLDVRLCSSLDYLNCSSCNLENLAVSNNALVYLDSLDAGDNPGLTCIQVDDVDDAKANTKWIVPDINLYLADCISCCQVYVPDDNFERALINLGYDRGPLDNYVQKSAVDTITSLNLAGLNIKNLGGIEYFISLGSLDISSNKLVSVELDSLLLLEELDCTSNYLSSLDIAANVNLVSLRCGDNKLVSLEISPAHTLLDTLVCDGNKLTALDIPAGVTPVYLVCTSNNILDLLVGDKSELVYLYCSRNRISSIDLTAYPLLVDFAISENLLSTLNLDLSAYPNALRRIDCSMNYLTGLTVNNITNLNRLNCSSNNIGSLTVDAATAASLDTLICDDNRLEDIAGISIDNLVVLSIATNRLTTLDVANRPGLVELNCSNNLLTTLPTTGMDALSVLKCNNNSLDALHLAGNANLTELKCSNNRIVTLELNATAPLVELAAGDNLLGMINLSTFSSLALLNLDNNGLTELNLENNTLLVELSCSGNSITSLDLGQCGLLRTLNAASNSLIGLNLANGNNINLTNAVLLNNPGLTCIQVDDVAYATANKGWSKDATASYSDNCHFNETYIPDLNFEQYLIDEGIDVTDPMGLPDSYVSNSDISPITRLDVSNLSIADLTGIEGFISLEVLNGSSNQLSSVSLAHNSSLSSLNLSDNLIDTLDLDGNTLIDTLDLSGNLLAELNLQSLAVLGSLTLDSNPLTDLDLSQNPLLTALSVKDAGLYTLDLRNSNNSYMLTLDATGNPGLTCIEVSDPAYASTAPGWLKDPDASYSLDCHYYETYVPDDNFEQTLISRGYDYSINEVPDDYVPTSKIKGLTSLNISNKGITDLTGIEDFESLRVLNCSYNLLTSLNPAGNILLEELNCSKNLLGSLDVTSNVLLRSLNASSNMIQDSIDIRSNPLLTMLSISRNNITDLYIGENPNLVSVISSSNDLWRVAAGNGNNHLLVDFDITGNPNLGCVIVDDPAAAATYPGWLKDSWSVYRTECTDNDNDGVPNSADSCKYTPFGMLVDLFGCSLYMLPYDNFTIWTKDEVCRDQNNGIINIQADRTLDYSGVLTGSSGSRSYLFTNGIEIRNVWAGSYTLCLYVDGQPGFERCFDLVIEEPEDLAVLSTINSVEETVLLELDGGKSYTVTHNDREFVTTVSEVLLQLDEGLNRIRVIADNECQGIWEETIVVSDDILFYPNPFDDHFLMHTSGETGGELLINIYSYTGQLMFTERHAAQDGPIRIDAPGLPSGLYVVTVTTATSQSKFEIIKR